MQLTAVFLLFPHTSKVLQGYYCNSMVTWHHYTKHSIYTMQECMSNMPACVVSCICCGIQHQCKEQCKQHTSDATLFIWLGMGWPVLLTSDEELWAEWMLGSRDTGRATGTLEGAGWHETGAATGAFVAVVDEDLEDMTEWQNDTKQWHGNPMAHAMILSTKFKLTGQQWRAFQYVKSSMLHNSFIIPNARQARQTDRRVLHKDESSKHKANPAFPLLCQGHFAQSQG